ncbi:hypothetical protein AALB_0774 [Agarivorans albus MKT 106]|uniref:Uncharacterized protein n=1 Tax=Agarivorans albus MKT 106 TaxID=1331007 RepID=R9PH25_AGAAL|nr:hypothetical protein AALB_0774 [Agarivorans albus MKT 106]
MLNPKSENLSLSSNVINPALAKPLKNMIKTTEAAFIKFIFLSVPFYKF